MGDGDGAATKIGKYCSQLSFKVVGKVMHHVHFRHEETTELSDLQKA